MMRAKEDGAILLTTILVMSLMATLAVAMFDDVRLGVKRTTHIQDYAQADWYAKGAQDFAQSYLTDNYANLSRPEFSAVLLNPQPIVFPIEGGALSLTLRDGTQCIDVNTVTGGSGARQFRKLLLVLGWDNLSAANMTAAAADWIDEDTQILPGGAEDYSYLGLERPYRTANTAMHAPSEVLALRDIDAKAYALLRPFVCARPSQQSGAAEQSAININTLTPAHAPVLAALLPEQTGYTLALSLITDRQAAGYESLEQIQSVPAMDGIETANIDFDSLVTAPRYIWVEADIAYRGARRIMAMEFDITGAAPILISRRIGEEARRPLLGMPSRAQQNQTQAQRQKQDAP